MTFLKLGFRSLFRQKRRTLITLLVITFGIGCLMLTVGHSSYIEWGLRESTIHSETGHLQIFHEDFYEKDEDTILQYGLENFESIREDLNGLTEVSLVLARIDLMGLISNGDKSVACIGQAVEPRLEKQMRNLFRMSGASFDSLIVHEEEEDIVVLGTGLAKSLNAKSGDWLTLMTTTADGALNAVDLKFVGTTGGVSPEYDSRSVLMPLRAAQYLLNSEKVKKILVVIDETEKTDQIYARMNELIQKKGYPVTVKKWHEQAAYYTKVKQFYNQMIGFISVVLFLIVFFSTSNTIVMTIVERTTEIGTLLSIGTSRWQTVKTFFFEGLFIGIIGGILSALFAFGGMLLINHLNIELPPPPGLTSGYPLMIRATVDMYVQIFFITVIIASVSSILPAFRVTRMKIVDALGHI